ncbi:MAG: TrkA family potassium uptake protein [Dehalococcoidales bacterium]|nr:TrkA family potassium uptake protein [Dehalococcoidales bacterium]
MYIIIVGGGRVGYYLTEALLKEGHEILLIEENPAVCEVINEELGSVCMRGDGCEVVTLEAAGTSRADMLVSVTADDEDNLIACQVAKHKFKVPRTIARIRNPKNKELFEKLGVNVPVISTNLILEHITEEVPTHPVTHLMELRDKGLEIIEMKIPAGCACVGRTIKDIVLPHGSILSLIIRKSQNPIIPTDSTVLMADDQIIAVTPPQAEAELRAVLIGE